MRQDQILRLPLLQEDFLAQANGQSTRIYRCDKCNKVYKYYNGLYTHKRFECGKQKSFHCVPCNKAFWHKQALQKHQRCSNCDDVDSYIKFMEEGKYQCLKCYKLYKHKFTLTRHLVYECMREPPFACHLCSYTCTRKHRLEEHLRSRIHSSPMVLTDLTVRKIRK
ncbi:hypothetical protein NQ315_001081 [Exocentrus adspersus]|uniref:C2H2-type domain-containing protein n=1 Tax=Exocentrus adspersus TaxID=1586481 RepID=A0AAV8WE66_9CUCU|nr:hypothetical protein NQ315_001081 [Exocentrus adspersus]